MSKQKYVAKIDCKRKRLCKLSANELLISNKGMTLIEIMIASAISVVVSLGIAGIYIFAIQQFTILVNMNTAQENALWIAYHTKSLMSQSVNLSDVQNCNPNTALSSIIGCIPDRTTASDGTMVTAAAFQREWSQGGEAGGVIQPSEILPTAIFFRQPSPNLEGRLFFDINTVPGNLLTATEDDIVYGQVVQYDLNTTVEPMYGINQATGTEVVVTTRYHRTTDATKQRWCVVGAANAACTNGASTNYDVTMRFNVGFRNNRALEKTNNQSRSIHGGIYYYRFIPPLFMNN